VKTKFAYVAAMIAALSVPLLALTVPIGCSSSPAAPQGSDSGVTPGMDGSTPTGDSGVQQEAAPPPSNTMPVPLTPSSTGYVTGNAAAITGAWYAYGDSWGTEMEMGMAGVAGEEGNCQLLGGFPTSSCSSITSPLPAFPVDAGTAAAGDAAAATDAAIMVPAGYDNGFPPSATGAMCLTGNAAKVITPDGGTAPDYSDIFGKKKIEEKER